MEARAYQKYIGISRRKIARVSNTLKKKPVKLAKAYLVGLPQKAGKHLLNAIKSAEANFLQKSPNSNTEELQIKNIIVEEGMRAKRTMPRARGSADRIIKRSAHILVTITDEIINQEIVKAKASRKIAEEKNGTKS